MKNQRRIGRNILVVLFSVMILSSLSKSAHGQIIFLNHFSNDDLPADIAKGDNEAKIPASKPRINLVEGKIGHGADIDFSKDEGAVLSYSAVGNLDPREGTLQLWLKPAWDGGQNCLPKFCLFWISSEGGKNYFALFGGKGIRPEGADSYVQFHSRMGHEKENQGDWVMSANNTWKKGEWHHVAVTWMGSIANLFLDGEFVRTGKYVPIPKLDANSLMSIGSHHLGWTRSARIVVDELMMEDRCKGKKEIAHDYQWVKSGKELPAPETTGQVRAKQKPDAPRLKIGSYEYSDSRGVLADPQRTKLSDGDVGTSIECLSGWLEMDIYFRFDSPVDLKEIWIHSFKKGELSGLHNLDVYACYPDGDVLIGHEPGFGYYAPPKLRHEATGEMHTFRYTGLWPKAEMVRVRISGSGTLLNEVSFFGHAGEEKLKYARLPPSPDERTFQRLTEFHFDPTPSNNAFAYPFPGKKLKILAVVPNLNQGEVWQLARNFEAEWVCPFWMNRSRPQFEEFYVNAEIVNSVIERLIRNHEFDAFLLGGVNWDILSPAVRETILQQVDAGAGMVYIDPAGKDSNLWQILPVKPVRGETRSPFQPTEPEHYITQGIPWLVMDGFFKGVETGGYELIHGKTIVSAGSSPLLAVGTKGEGKIAVLTYKTSVPHVDRGGITPGYLFEQGDTLLGDYLGSQLYYGLVSRCLLWATRKEPEHVIQNILANRIASSNNVDVKVKCQRAVRRVEMFSMSKETHETSKVMPLRTKGGAWKGRINSLPAGENLIWVRASDGHGILDWAVEVINITPAHKLSLFELDQESIMRGEYLTGKLRTETGHPGSTGARIVVQLWDGFHRLCDKKLIQVLDKETNFKISTDCVRTILNVLEAKVERKDGTIVSEVYRIPVAIGQNLSDYFDDFHVCLWGALPRSGMRPHLLPHVMKNFHEAGVDSIVSYWKNDDPLAWLYSGFSVFVIGWIFDVFTVPKEIDNKFDLVRKPCFSDPEFMRSVRKQIKSLVRKSKQFSPIAYGLGDEQEITRFYQPKDVCFCPHCIKGFRQWSREQYDNIDKLNKQWDSDYKSFAEVVPATLAEVRGKDSMSSWADHRTYMDEVFSHDYRSADDSLRKIDPSARIMISGSRPPHAMNGWDWPKLVPNFEVLLSYTHHPNFDELTRAFSKGKNYTHIGGYGRSGNNLKYLIWRATMRKAAQGVSAFMAPLLIRGDLSMVKGMEDFSRYVQPLKEGIGMLLNQASYDTEPIGVLYSQSSIQATYAMGFVHSSGNLGMWRDICKGSMEIIKELGLQSTFISKGTLIDRKSLLENYRLIVLPFSIALSDKEIGVLEDFVRRGGCLISLGPAGYFDKHLKRRASNRMENILGIHFWNLKPEEGEYTAGFHWEDISGSISGYYRAVKVKNRDAQVVCQLGELPLVTVNSYGAGKAIYIEGGIPADYFGRSRNASMYRTLEKYSAGVEGIEKIFAKCVSLAELEAKVKIYGENGTDIHGIETFSYHLGDSQIVGLLRNYDVAQHCWPGSVKATVVFPEEAYVHEMVEGKSLGKTKKAEIVLRPDSVYLFSLLPYRVEKMKILGPRRISAGNRLTLNLKVLASARKVGDHILHLKVHDPQGRKSYIYSANLTAKNGRAEISIPFALNDISGRWHIECRDVISGVKDTHIVSVK